jgi:alpha-beta hydrolase superfamily lysophospholipase
MSDGWAPDILGPPFEQLTLPLERDAEGDVVATLVRRMPTWLRRLTAPLADVDALYVHGWSDYFFQTELAAFWTNLGARFYALDLRKYGRSLREGQTPGYVSDFAEYDADIAAALAAMGHVVGERVDAAARRRLLLMGHSTGGLVLTLWAARHPGIASALVLNSPWLELQIGATARQAIAPLVQVRARLDPLGAHPVADLGFYSRAQREIGSLPRDEQRALWRPDTGFATHPGWLNAVLAAHRAVAAGIDVGCAALVLLSTRSSSPFTWTDDKTAADSVLVVDDIAKAATRIGRRVTIARIEGAIHDVFLSAPAPRAEAYAALAAWTVDQLGRR